MYAVNFVAEKIRGGCAGELRDGANIPQPRPQFQCFTINSWGNPKSFVSGDNPVELFTHLHMTGHLPLHINIA